jgi:hypothetical protein
MAEGRLLERITHDPKIFGGKPIIRGRRLALEHTSSGCSPPATRSTRSCQVTHGSSVKTSRRAWTTTKRVESSDRAGFGASGRSGAGGVAPPTPGRLPAGQCVPFRLSCQGRARAGQRLRPPPGRSGRRVVRAQAVPARLRGAAGDRRGRRCPRVYTDVVRSSARPEGVTARHGPARRPAPAYPMTPPRPGHASWIQYLR